MERGFTVAHFPAKVLLIDPDPDVCAMFTEILRDAGFHVEQLPGRAEPVAFAEKVRPNVIVLGVWPEPFPDAQIAADLQKNPQLIVRIVPDQLVFADNGFGVRGFSATSDG